MAKDGYTKMFERTARRIDDGKNVINEKTVNEVRTTNPFAYEVDPDEFIGVAVGDNAPNHIKKRVWDSWLGFQSDALDVGEQIENWMAMPGNIPMGYESIEEAVPFDNLFVRAVINFLMDNPNTTVSELQRAAQWGEFGDDTPATVTDPSRWQEILNRGRRLPYEQLYTMIANMFGIRESIEEANYSIEVADFEGAEDRQIIQQVVSYLQKMHRKLGQEQLEYRLDTLLMDFAQDHGLIYDREGDTLMFRPESMRGYNLNSPFREATQLKLPFRMPAMQADPTLGDVIDEFPKNKWENWGDADYLTYGGNQIRFDGVDEWEVVELITPDAGPEGYSIRDTVVDLRDILGPYDLDEPARLHQPTTQTLKVASFVGVENAWENGDYAQFIWGVVDGWPSYYGGNEIAYYDLEVYDIEDINTAEPEQVEDIEADVRQFLSRTYGIKESCGKPHDKKKKKKMSEIFAGHLAVKKKKKKHANEGFLPDPVELTPDQDVVNLIRDNLSGTGRSTTESLMYNLVNQVVPISRQFFNDIWEGLIDDGYLVGGPTEYVWEM